MSAENSNDVITILHEWHSLKQNVLTLPKNTLEIRLESKPRHFTCQLSAYHHELQLLSHSLSKLYTSPLCLCFDAPFDQESVHCLMTVMLSMYSVSLSLNRKSLTSDLFWGYEMHIPHLKFLLLISCNSTLFVDSSSRMLSLVYLFFQLILNRHLYGHISTAFILFSSSTLSKVYRPHTHTWP